jgi:Carboxypeptidase regulatory-like domain
MGRTSVRLIRGIAILFSFFLPLWSSLPQSPTGTISGQVLDPDGRAIAGAEILVVNDLTGLQYAGKSNEDGIYVFPNLLPGPYRIQVSKVGFKALIKPDIVLNVQDALSVNFKLPIGAASIVVTVPGGAPLVNTTDGSLSTVVDRSYIENMPLNGRSFQDLILLSPGVVTNTPQTSFPQIGNNGEFSVNGQRAESNYYVVDGVSGNIGIAPGFPSAVSTSGSLPAASALGTTQGLVPVDALEEFRIETSTYSAEFGRNPGGQFSFATRSGTSQWHGTAFDYLRNDFFDANDWFNDYYKVAQPALRQNDFGGTLGGPIRIPRFRNDKDKTFFFFSYEGLRLDQPQEATLNYVPDTTLRQSTPAPLQAVLNAFPLPNGPEVLVACVPATDPTCPSTGLKPNGLAEYIASWSNPSHIDSTNIRFDHLVNEKWRVFFRFGNTSSEVLARSGGNYTTPSSFFPINYTTRTGTLGITTLLWGRVSDELRLNFSSNQSLGTGQVDTFGGAQPVDLAQLQGIQPGSAYTVQIQLQLNGGAYAPYLTEERALGSQRQWNLVDTAAVAFGRHQLKFGIDYRRLAPIQKSGPYVSYEFLSAESVQANAPDIVFADNVASAYPIYKNLSIFADDKWRVTPRFSASLGLRWELNPAPSAEKGNLPYTVEGNSLSTLALAPQGTALWKTSWYNFAPRLGAAYILRSTPGYETVLRGGAGVFYDTGQQLGSQGYQGVGFSQSSVYFGGVGSGFAFPVAPAQAEPPIVNPPVAPYTGSEVFAFPSHLQLPYTLQWNATVDQALGRSQVLTLSYVGANGRKLLQENEVGVGNVNPDFGTVLFFHNGLTSDYDALQVRFQRRLTNGLMALASYTWSHSIDYGSSNASLPYIRGNSAFDVRHNFSTALSYDPQRRFANSFARTVLNHWGIDTRFTARTGFPVTLDGQYFFDSHTQQSYPAGLDLVPGQPFYVYGSAYPGGRAVNAAAFSYAAAGTVGDAPRNFVRGFGAWQEDLAVRREFPLHETLKLQFRAEAFNLFNHPNFGTINSNYCSPGPFCTFGQAQNSLATGLGVLSAVYQMGGPRSMQFALKLIF